MKNRRQCVAYVFPLRGKREVAMFESNLLYMVTIYWHVCVRYDLIVFNPELHALKRKIKQQK